MGSYVEKRISNRDRLLMVEEYVNAALMENKIFAASDVAKAIYDDTDYIDYKSLNKYIYADLDALKTAGYDFVTVAGKGYRILSRPDKLAPSDIALLKECVNGTNALSDLTKDTLNYKLSTLGTNQEEQSNPLSKRITELMGYIGDVHKGKHLHPKLVKKTMRTGIYAELSDYPFVKPIPSKNIQSMFIPYQIKDGCFVLGYDAEYETWGEIDIRQIISIEYIEDVKNGTDIDLEKCLREKTEGEASFLEKLLADKNAKNPPHYYNVSLRISKWHIQYFISRFGRPDYTNYKKYIIKDDPDNDLKCLVLMEVFKSDLDAIIWWSLSYSDCEIIGSNEAVKEKETLLREELMKLEKPV